MSRVVKLKAECLLWVFAVTVLVAIAGIFGIYHDKDFEHL
jgi:hypothetical protein